MSQEISVTKANKLVEASYRLGINEQRMMALLVAQIHPDDEEFKPYRFRIAEIEELISNQERTQKALYARVKALTRGLAGKALQIQEADGLLQVSWLSSAKYYDGTGIVELKFAPEMKPYLLQLQERFTTYRLGNIVKLRSRYSVRLYELLKQYEALGKRGFELAELRQALGVGVDEYAAWKDFRVRVLDPAKRELPKKTDLAFDYTTRKRIRAVAWVDFVIRAAKQTKKKPSPSEESKQCYREHNYGSSCDVQDLAALNKLPKRRREICMLCTNHQHELFSSAATQSPACSTARSRA